MPKQPTAQTINRVIVEIETDSPITQAQALELLDETLPDFWPTIRANLPKRQETDVISFRLLSYTRVINGILSRRT